MYELSREIREKTQKCATEFSCLSNPAETLCKAEFLLQNNILFVNKENARLCPYFLEYGSSGICTCPVRLELYNRYQL
jgi:hypothetical protein